MLFNSYEFILVFLPLTWLGFYAVAKLSPRAAAAWLAAASLLFYAWWNPKFVALLVLSVAFNYAMGRQISLAHGHGRSRLLTAAVTTNLAVLGVFKYANFFLHSVGDATGLAMPGLDIVLPLGISFFTFTQIAFLVDVHRGIAQEYRWIHYALFVTYFPHLIAGPVLHHKQMMPQFASASIYRPQAANVAIGLTIFVIGLAKKVLLADRFSPYASGLFTAVGGGVQPELFGAWLGVLAYTLQLYFDFSGYSDMAVGLSLLFGVRLPLNFNSPYKAANIIDFWRRWHMTLSMFLRDYLYIPLGGNRLGPVRRYLNLFLTMLLGGLWHGANWTYVVWGGLHGAYLIVNHAWQALCERAGWTAPAGAGGTAVRLLGHALTFFAVVAGWVFFRSEDFASAVTILSAMAGLCGASPAQAATLIPALAGQFQGWMLIAAGLAIVWCAPNTQEWVRAARNGEPETPEDGRQHWRPTLAVGVAVGIVFALCFMSLNRTSEFLYFQF